MEEMSVARHYAAAVLDESGDLWMLGGVSHGSAAADSTEIFDFRRRRWRKGRPLPAYLRSVGRPLWIDAAIPWTILRIYYVYTTYIISQEIADTMCIAFRDSGIAYHCAIR